MLSNEEILTIVSDELQQAETYTDWETPLNYYVGGPNGLEIDGRSQVVSTDVADAIEWILPQIMKSFTQTNEVVIFDPIGPEDEKQSELESLYVHDVFMKENPGFIILHTFAKDALLHNNGIVKIYYDSTDKVAVNKFSGIPFEQFVALANDQSATVIDYEKDDFTGTVSATIQLKTTTGKVTVLSIPPEQFRVNSDHDSIDLTHARFTAHVTQKTLSDLRKEGFDASSIDSLVTSSLDSASNFRYEVQDNASISYNQSMDESQHRVDVAECYLQIDINEDGIAELCKITVAGDSDSPTAVLLVEEIDYLPWVATTGILMSHKFRGLSIFDRLKQIQDQKTALLRNILDNLYLQNNQRHMVVEGQANIDDLLLSRPGGVIRVKRQDAVVPLITPPIGQDAYTMMQYLDSVRAGRVGVAPEGEVTPQRIGDQIGSEGVTALLTAKEELVGLIVRVIAETGVKPLYLKIRELLVRHVDAVQNYKYKGQWIQTSPAQWADRIRSTVRVGTGTGNHAKQLAALLQLQQIQGTIMLQQGQTLIQPDKIYALLDDIAKYSELTGASKYFTDPSSPAGQKAAQMSGQTMQEEKQKQNQQQMALLQSQVQLAQAELQKAQAQQDNVILKGQVEQLKHQLGKAQEMFKLAGGEADRMLEKYKIDSQAALKLTELEIQSKQQEDKNLQQNKEAVSE